MKKKRHEKILELIQKYSIDTQEELLRLLRKEGYDVTQATVSRDIKELRLLKMLSPDGKYRYVPAKDDSKSNSGKFFSLFADSAVSVASAQNIVCVKCQPGMANAVCAAMDALYRDDVVGTLAGDDTIFILTHNDKEAELLAEELNDIIR
ncbi:MAG: Arginine repressor [Thermocaproicibacter melissae]|uniref:arginine repressor n=1 Tax=Thermocaproicibacter melissae TaxID=2966552 RepID=UPI003A1033B1